MSAVRGKLDIAAGQSATQVFDKREYALGLAVLMPSGLQGILGIRVSVDPNGPFDPIYDDGNVLIQIDPSAFTLPVWVVIKADIMPVHYLKFQTFTDTSESTPQTQSSARTLYVMGTA